ncbi:hypothetical protein Tco_1149961 [Tanacetum coccineum]
MGVFGGVEKVRALGANRVIKGSTIGAVWFEVSGGMVGAKVVLMVVLGLSCIRVIKKRCLQVLRCEDDERLSLETDIRQKDEKSSKNRQNRARNGKAWKRQSQIEAKVNPSQSQVNPAKSTVKTGADTKEYLMGLPKPI